MLAGSEKPTSYLVAFTNPMPGKEDEYNDWYDNVHLKEVVAIDGFVSGRRFKLAEHQLGGVVHKFHYMVIYEVENGKSKAVIDALLAAMGRMNIPAVVDMSESPNYLVESIGGTYAR